MESYIDRNAKYMNAIIPANSTDKILKGISNALAYIADELHEQNGWMGGIQDLLCSIEQDIYLDMDHNVFEPDTEVDTDSPECFICGKPVDMHDIGGSITKSDGNVLLACSECAEKFDRCADLAASIVKF